MVIRWIGTLLLCLFALPASAQSSSGTWAFSYTGFLDYDTWIFDPEPRINGTFSGADLDGDGIITGDELTSLVIDGQEYIIDCDTDDYYNRCGFTSFSWVIGGEPDFVLGTWGNDEACSSWGRSYVSHLSISSYHYGCFDESRSQLLWTDDTRFEITQTVGTPVPEPSGVWLLALGLPLVAWRRMRGKRSD